MAEDDWQQWKTKGHKDKDIDKEAIAAQGNQSVQSDDSSNESSPEASTAIKPEKNLETTKEWRLIRTLVKDIQAEQVRRRRWGILFKSLTFIFLFIVAIGIWQESPVITQYGEPHIAVVDVNGIIVTGAPTSANNLVPLLNDAFENTAAEAVLLNINSPGGSPVQAGIIYDEIQRLKKLNPNKKIYAVVSDVGASGAYYIAAAADYIYADKASIVGSIGVIASGFGFTQLIDNIGVERRAYTAGGNKDFLDPFVQEKPEQRQMMQSLLDEVHQQFIAAVKQGRGERLVTHTNLFSGAFWNGNQALELGLLDGLGDIYSVNRDLLGDLPLHTYEAAKTPLEEIIDEVGAQAKIQLQSIWQAPLLR